MDSMRSDRPISGKRKGFGVDIPDAQSPRQDIEHTGNFVENEKPMAEKAQEEELLGCETPKSKAHLIPEATECPPAPKKRRPARASRGSKPGPPGGFFVVPRDFHLLFVPHKKAARPAKRSPRIEFARPTGDRHI